jgi:hypothetical protein
MQVIHFLGKWINKISAGRDIFRVASVHGISCESWLIAEIFVSGAAILASAIDSSDP